MIDTDKYEGVKGSLVHSISTQEWKKLSPAAQALLADAPLLLAEVKRLRERLIRAYDWAENAVNGNDSAMMDYTEYVCGGEEE